MNITTTEPSINHTTMEPPGHHLPEGYRYALLFLYSVVLAGGVISMSLMINILKSNVRSVTTTAVLNLIAVHLVFLLTVPFRIYYYASGQWPLGLWFCKVVSWMIFAHIQLAFIFYIIILIIRYVTFYQGTGRVEFYRTLHALFASVAVWAVVITVFLPIAINEYGSSTTEHDNKCFHFGDSLKDPAVAGLNYFLSGFTLLVISALAGCQVCILSRVYRTYRPLTFSHQEFWAQMKSLCFVLVMAVCFVPYNVFRIYYVNNPSDSLEPVNEVFLALTSLSCLDMLIFISRPTCASCCVP